MKVAIIPSNQVGNPTALPGVSEADVQKPIADAAVSRLLELGYEAKVFWHPEISDKLPMLKKECNEANAWGAELVVFNHSNDPGSTKAHGLMTVLDSGETRDDALAWGRRMHDELAARIRIPGASKPWGVTTDMEIRGFRYAFHRWIRQDAFRVCFEIGSHVNKATATYLHDKPQEIGSAIAEAVLAAGGEEEIDMTKEQYDALMEEIAAVRKTNAATSYRERILIALQQGRTEEADRLYAEAGELAGSLGYLPTGSVYVPETMTEQTPLVGTVRIPDLELGRRVPADHKLPGGSDALKVLVTSYQTWAARTNLRADVLFAQMLLETGGLRYGGQVKAGSFNFAGLKTTDGSGFASFADIEAGVIAHVFHLAWYAYPAHLPFPQCSLTYDPRHKALSETRAHFGTAKVLADLAPWADNREYPGKVARVWNSGI